MRGVYTSGVLEAFDEAGLRFDSVVACSAGACAAASYLAGQTWRNRHIYLDLLDGSKLVRYRRLFTGGNVMDIDYLTDDVTVRLCPMDLRALRASETKLHIAVTDWKTGEARYLNNHDDDLLTAFRATCALPLFYRGEVWYQGRRLVDGGVADPVPVARAVALGARDIVVVLTSSIEVRGVKKRFPRMISSSRAVRRALRERYRKYRDAATIIAAPPDGVSIRVVRASSALPVKRTTTDRNLLEQGCDLGKRDGAAFVAAAHRRRGARTDVSS